MERVFGSSATRSSIPLLTFLALLSKNSSSFSSISIIAGQSAFDLVELGQVFDGDSGETDGALLHLVRVYEVLIQSVHEW